jgi:hypothetical protein
VLPVIAEKRLKSLAESIRLVDYTLNALLQLLRWLP